MLPFPLDDVGIVEVILQGEIWELGEQWDEKGCRLAVREQLRYVARMHLRTSSCGLRISAERFKCYRMM